MKVRLPVISPLKTSELGALKKTEALRHGDEGRSSKFLTSRQHRIFPVNLNKEVADDYDVAQLTARKDSAVRRSFDEALLPFRLPVVKRGKQRNLSTVAGEDKSEEKSRSDSVKLPELRMRNYANETPLEAKSGRTDKKLARSPDRTKPARQPTLRVEPEPQRAETETDVEYDTLAVSYGQKLQRIRKLAESTMKMLHA